MTYYRHLTYTRPLDTDQNVRAKKGYYRRFVWPHLWFDSQSKYQLLVSQVEYNLARVWEAGGIVHQQSHQHVELQHWLRSHFWKHQEILCQFNILMCHRQKCYLISTSNLSLLTRHIIWLSEKSPSCAAFSLSFIAIGPNSRWGTVNCSFSSTIRVGTLSLSDFSTSFGHRIMYWFWARFKKPLCKAEGSSQESSERKSKWI